MSAIGDRIKKVRQMRGFTLEQLEKEHGINAVQLGKYERGVNTPGTKVLEKIARALGVEPADLVTERELKVGEQNKRRSQMYAEDLFSELNDSEVEEVIAFMIERKRLRLAAGTPSSVSSQRSVGTTDPVLPGEKEG